ncbi:hypothetical protein [Paractinoplanes brasiliensis]|uniref:Uncharacterized protein n=1 Tax=Paractinoplanes brasiliensis TaxID=52695 RepID=A0A4V6PSZ1_9ACTN|nr:hypothetical protein [Actinoplanes brasiliensis]TDO42228.1 hypothetical protein C8E87_5994 [Actinoplanes brasiliensis]GID31905.1 hypothetical protein Abr02nite_68880 [Actinoplanes brasiliensis]
MDSVANRVVGPGERRDDEGSGAGAGRLSLRRLYLLRAGYAFLGIGLAVVEWRGVFNSVHSQPLMDGVVDCMLVALSLLALLGIRYPVRMLPVLLFESAWKLIWLTVVGLPLWISDDMDPAAREVVYSCLLVVVVLAVIPWVHVHSHYVVNRGERWR